MIYPPSNFLRNDHSLWEGTSLIYVQRLNKDISKELYLVNSLWLLQNILLQVQLICQHCFRLEGNHFIQGRCTRNNCCKKKYMANLEAFENITHCSSLKVHFNLIWLSCVFVSFKPTHGCVRNQHLILPVSGQRLMVIHIVLL